MPIQANPVNWFEIPVSDLDRAKKFYEAAFGAEQRVFLFHAAARRRFA